MVLCRVGGSFAVIPHDTTGKLPDNLPVMNGHTAAVLDTDFNPFNDNIIASASEDCKVGSRRTTRRRARVIALCM